MKIKILLAFLVAGFVCLADQNLSTKYSISVDQSICQGRLTLESGVPVSVTDQTAKTTLYFTPNVTGENCGNKITIYDGTKWVLYSFSELSFVTSSLTASTNYDIFIYNNSGTLTLSSTAWTNDTTRATALTTQDGIYVKSGATSYRYLGTIRITSTTGQCEDSAQNRFVWNLYNRKLRRLIVCPGYNDNNSATSVSITNTSYAEFVGGGSAGAGTMSFVVGVAENAISIETFTTIVAASTYQSWIGIGYDSTTTASAASFANGGATAPALAIYSVTPSIGKHYISILCMTQGGTATWFIDTSRFGGAADPRATIIKATIFN